MYWKCLECATETNLVSEDFFCKVCTQPKPVESIIIKSRNNGRTFPIRPNIDKTKKVYGKTILQILNDPDIKYVSENQFAIWKSDQGIWVESVPGALNSTFCNGYQIPDGGLVLKHGDVLSIRDKFFFLEVNLA